MSWFTSEKENKNMEKNTIPPVVANAVLSLLSPYVPDITADKLVARLSGHPHSLRTEYTRKEVAERLGVSLRTVDSWTADGTLEVIKLGKRRLLITAESVDALLVSGGRRRVLI
jgi:excisionase family DNA binding protein